MMPDQKAPAIRLPEVTEMQIEALARASGLPPATVIAGAVENQILLAAYQMGREGAALERLFALLLTLPQAPETSSEVPDHGSNGAGAAVAPPSEAQRAILEAAAQMDQPFSSRDLARRMGTTSSGTVGQVLTMARWPAEARLEGGSRKWLPRRPTATA